MFNEIRRNIEPFYSPSDHQKLSLNVSNRSVDEKKFFQLDLHQIWFDYQKLRFRPQWSDSIQTTTVHYCSISYQLLFTHSSSSSCSSPITKSPPIIKIQIKFHYSSPHDIPISNGKSEKKIPKIYYFIYNSLPLRAPPNKEKKKETSAVEILSRAPSHPQAHRSEKRKSK